QPATVLKRAMQRHENRLVIGEREYSIADRPVYALAVGKAAVEMLTEAKLVLGDTLAGGLAVAKAVHRSIDPGFRIVIGSHPVPDQQSLDAGAAALEFAGDVPDGALVVCLISGGGSALMESLRPGVSLEDLQGVTRSLLRSGAS